MLCAIIVPLPAVLVLRAPFWSARYSRSQLPELAPLILQLTAAKSTWCSSFGTV
jgi:hypothetical protein